MIKVLEKEAIIPFTVWLILFPVWIIPFPVSIFVMVCRNGGEADIDNFEVYQGTIAVNNSKLITIRKRGHTFIRTYIRTN